MRKTEEAIEDVNHTKDIEIMHSDRQMEHKLYPYCEKRWNCRGLRKYIIFIEYFYEILGRKSFLEGEIG